MMGPGDKSREHNTNLIDFLEFANAVELGEMLLSGALRREESRGAHYRKDYPEQNDEEYDAHTLYRKEDGVLAIDFGRSYA
jgi:succinate dehydrogenase/fumarate reductase flavoprotein subunit